MAYLPQNSPPSIRSITVSAQPAAPDQRIVARGRVYLSNAVLHGKFCLRACIVNHLTRETDIDAVVPEVLAAGRE